MGKTRVTRKQLLKEPDEFITLTGKAILFLRTHRKLIAIGVIGFFAVIVGLAAHRYLSGRWENAASLALQKNVSQYEKAQADGQSPGQALSAIEEEMKYLLKRYGGQTSGHLGRLFYADAMLAAGRFEEALMLYRDTKNHFDATSFFYYRILESIAQAHLALKQNDKAATMLQQVADGTGAGMADAALFQLGLVYKAGGDTDRSRAAFRSLTEKYPDSPYVDIINDQIQAG